MSQIFVFYIITTSGHVVLFINFLNIENLVKKLEYRFLVESTKIENTVFHIKIPCQKSMLRQIEWVVQNGHIFENFV